MHQSARPRWKLIHSFVLFLFLPYRLIVGHNAIASVRDQDQRPKLKPDQVWISSIPVGLEIGICKFISESARHEAESKGKTPVLLSLGPDRYLISIEFPRSLLDDRDNAVPEKGIFGYMLSSPEGSLGSKDIRFFSGLPVREKDRFTRWYLLEKQVDKSLSFIALFTPKYHSFEEIDSFYPKKSHFRFSLAQLEELLDKYEIGDIDKNKVAALLERGGKISLETKRGFVNIEVSASNGLDAEEIIQQF